MTTSILNDYFRLLHRYGKAGSAFMQERKKSFLRETKGYMPALNEFVIAQEELDRFLQKHPEMSRK